MNENSISEKLLDQLMTILFPYRENIDMQMVKAKIIMLLDDYQISPKETAISVYTNGKNEYFLKRFLLAKAVAGRQKRTLEQYSIMISMVLRQIGKDADTITANDIQAYIARKMTSGASKSYCDTIRRYMNSFYTWLYKEEMIKTNPLNKVEKIKYKVEKETALTDMEIELIRAACETSMQRAVVETLLSTGCRASELVSIHICDIDRDKIQIEGKGGKFRTVYLNAKSIVAIKSYLKERKDNNPYLFPQEVPASQRKGCPTRNWFKYPEFVTDELPCQIDSVNQMVRRIGKRAGVSGVHTHRFRKTCATMALRHGMPIELVSMMLGHEQITTTQIYLDIKESDLQAAHEKYVV